MGVNLAVLLRAGLEQAGSGQQSGEIGHVGDNQDADKPLDDFLLRGRFILVQKIGPGVPQEAHRLQAGIADQERFYLIG